MGFDNVSNYTLKILCGTIAPFLSEIFNLCLKFGVYPDILKVAIKLHQFLRVGIK